MSELQKELDKDKAFINKVQERIYCESGDWEDSIAEPEWIMDMTDLADKYSICFKAAENGRRQVVQDKAKLFEMSKPKLNENQEIVLACLKKEYAERKLFPTEVTWLLFESVDNGYFEPEEERAFENLNKLQEAQVLQAFASWVEQEEE